MSKGRHHFFYANSRALTLPTSLLMPNEVPLPTSPDEKMEENEEKIPDLLECPIGKDWMTEPVTTNCHHHFDKKNISEWREKHHDSCPCCRAKITSLKPNPELKQVVDYIFKMKNQRDSRKQYLHKQKL